MAIALDAGTVALRWFALAIAGLVLATLLLAPLLAPRTEFGKFCLFGAGVAAVFALVVIFDLPLPH